MANEYVYRNHDETDKGFREEGYSTTHDDWSKASTGNGHADHVCRPVIVDALGRRRPIICFTPVANNGTHVTTIETVVERFPPPAVAEQMYGYPVAAEEYKYAPRQPERETADKHSYGYPVRMEYRLSSPGNVEEHKSNHSHPVRVEEYYRHISPAKSSVHDRPPKVEEFVTKIQAEVSQLPARSGPLTALNWRRTQPKTPAVTGGYGEYSKEDYNWNKPNGGQVIIRNESYDHDNEYYRRHDGGKEPTAAVTVMPWSGQHVRLAAGGPRYIETIDSKEAAKRYGNSGASPRPYLTGGGIIIDSKMAEEKYKGARVG